MSRSPTETEQIDGIILELAHQAGLIERGKTITADWFPEAQAAIQALLTAARLAEAQYWEQSVIPTVRGHQFQYEVDKRVKELSAPVACVICGQLATTEYEGENSCGRPICEFQIQEGIDHLADVGSN